MKRLFLSLLLFAHLPLLCNAEVDDLKPGLYAIVDGQPTTLSFTYGKSTVRKENLYGVEVTHNTFIFDADSSGVKADSTFILVLDPQLSKPVKKMKEYIPFIKSMKPAKMILVPLVVDEEQHRREFRPGATWDMIRFDGNGSIKFAWKKISNSSFEINTHGLPEGEYGFIFKTEAAMGYDYTAIFAFTVQAKNNQ